MEFFLLNALLKVFLFQKVCDRDQVELEAMVLNRGGVEDTRLEAKAKDTKKIRGQGQGQPFRGQTLSRPKDRNARGQDQGYKCKCSPKKKKSSQKFFTKF